MSTLQIIDANDFDNLTNRLNSLSEDYHEFLGYLVELQETPYSLEYVHARLYIFKGYFDRALAGLQNTSFRFAVAQRLNGQLENFFLQKALLDDRLRNFIQTCSRDESLQQKLLAATDSKEANINVETFRARMSLKDDEDLNSLDILNAVTTLDDLRLYLDERKQLGLEAAFHLPHTQISLEEQFSQIEKLFWNNLPLLLEFRHAIKEYRDRFLIFQDKKYPWWYPEKRKAKARPLAFASCGGCLIEWVKKQR